MLKTSIGDTAYGIWFSDVEFRLPGDHTVLVVVPSRFTADYIEANYSDQIRTCCNRSGTRILKVRYRVGSAKQQTRQKKARDPGVRKNQDWLDSRYTFENFVVGRSNMLAHSAAVKISESRDDGEHRENFGRSLYLHGRVGLGKTHLMKAIGWALSNNRPEARVRYMTAETFTSQFVSSSRSRKIHEFRDGIRSLDILLVDDVQFFVGKTKTTEELELTLDALTSDGRIMIMSGNTHIDRIPQFGSRIQSRIQQGLVARIVEPDSDLRLQILQSKLHLVQQTSPGFRLDDGVLEFVAQRIAGDIRRLEGALGRLSAAASYIPLPISLDHAIQLLTDLLDIQPARPKLDDIVEAVAGFYGLKPNDLVGKSRAANISRARQIGIYLANEMTTRSATQIGRHFSRDHTTVTYSIKRIRGLCNSRQDVVNDIDAIRKGLNLPT